jgi:hypothetical protein
MNMDNSTVPFTRFFPSILPTYTKKKKKKKKERGGHKQHLSIQLPDPFLSGDILRSKTEEDTIWNRHQDHKLKLSSSRIHQRQQTQHEIYITISGAKQYHRKPSACTSPPRHLHPPLIHIHIVKIR